MRKLGILFVFMMILNVPAGVWASISNVKVTNVEHTRFFVSWVSSEPEPGEAQINGNANVEQDVRLNSSPDNPFFDPDFNPYTTYTHLIEFSSLDPQTTYQFEIISGDVRYPLDDDSYYEATTGVFYVDPQPKTFFFSGNVNSVNDGQVVSAEGALIHVQFSQSGVASNEFTTVVRGSTNSFFLGIPQMYNQNLNTPYPFNFAMEEMHISSLGGHFGTNAFTLNVSETAIDLGDAYQMTINFALQFGDLYPETPDGIIGSGDVQALVGHVLQVGPGLSGQQFIEADINGDGLRNVSDVIDLFELLD